MSTPNINYPGLRWINNANSNNTIVIRDNYKIRLILLIIIIITTMVLLHI